MLFRLNRALFYGSVHLFSFPLLALVGLIPACRDVCPCLASDGVDIGRGEVLLIGHGPIGLKLHGVLGRDVLWTGVREGWLCSLLNLLGGGDDR